MRAVLSEREAVLGECAVALSICEILLSECEVALSKPRALLCRHPHTKSDIPLDEAFVVNREERSELQALRLQLSDMLAELKALNAEVDEAVAFLEQAGLDTENLLALKRIEAAARNFAFSDAVRAVILLKDADSIQQDADSIQHKKVEDCMTESMAKEPCKFQDSVFRAVQAAFKDQMGGKSNRWKLLQRALSWIVSDGNESKVPTFNDVKCAIRTEYERQWADAEKQCYAKYRAAGLCIGWAKAVFTSNQIEKRRKAARDDFAAVANEVIDDLCEEFHDSSKLPCIVTHIGLQSKSIGYMSDSHMYRWSTGTQSWQQKIEVQCTRTVHEPSKVECTVQSVLPADVSGLLPSWSSSNQCGFVLPEEDLPLLIHPIEPTRSVLVVTGTGEVFLVPRNRGNGAFVERDGLLRVRRDVSKASYDPAGRFLCLFSRGENQAVVYRFDVQFKTLQQTGQPLNFADHGLDHVCNAMLIPGKKVRARKPARVGACPLGRSLRVCASALAK